MVGGEFFLHHFVIEAAMSLAKKSSMKIRTSKKTVTFKNAFSLGGVDEALPSGDYTVETDEELLEGVSFAAYKRVSTRLHLHAKASQPGIRQTLTVDPAELDAAQQRDQSASFGGSVIKRDKNMGTD